MKMMALLVLLTLVIVVLPLLPAIEEWRRPSDVTPLPIDESDALEPDYMARRFAARLDEAIDQGLITMGDVPLVHVPRQAIHAPWPLDEKEIRTGRSRRIWHADGACHLPEHLDCLAEMSARGAMRAAAGRTYRALLSRGHLALPERVRVLRWAHGQCVTVGDRCELPARVSADGVILLGREVSFSLLHAGAIRFAGIVPPDQPVPPTGCWSIGPADGVQWAGPHGPGRAERSLHVPALRRWRGDLACAGHLTLGEGCVAEGSLRAAGSISIGAGAQVHGGLVAPGDIYLAAGTTVHASIVSETAVVLGPGCIVGVPGAHATVRAPRVQIGKGVVVHGTVWAGRQLLSVGHDDDRDPVSLAADPTGQGERIAWDPVSGRGLAGSSIRIGPRRAWDGDLVCQGDLEIGHRSHARGSLKAYGDLGLGAGTRVDGCVVARGDILLGAGAAVNGSVMSETAVMLGPGCTIGTPQQPATVCAPRIEVALGVVVHGTIWAGRSGDAIGTLQHGTDVMPDESDELTTGTPAAALPGRVAA
jgi:hypothetical protein